MTEKNPNELARLAQLLVDDLEKEYAALGKLIFDAKQLAIAASRQTSPQDSNETSDQKDFMTPEYYAKRDASYLRLLAKKLENGYTVLRKMELVNTENHRENYLEIEWQIHLRSKPEAPSFPQFQRLPPEIQFKIWEFAMPNHPIADAGVRRRRMPTIGQVCYDSRKIAIKMSKTCSCTEIVDRNGVATECRVHPVGFDPRRGVLILPHAQCGAHPQLARRRQVILDISGPISGGSRARIFHNHSHRRIDFERATRVIESGWFGGLFNRLHPTYMRNKTINLMRWAPTLINHKSASPEFIEALFGGKEHVILDLTDILEVRRIANLFKQHQHNTWKSRGLACSAPDFPEETDFGKLEWVTTYSEGWWNDRIENGFNNRLQKRLLEHQTPGSTTGLPAAQISAAFDALRLRANIRIKPVHIFVHEGHPQHSFTSCWWEKYRPGLRYQGVLWA